MKEIKLGTVEAKFADIIWQNAPLGSGELVKLCSNQLEWKKSTTYTVLKKLCERGIFKNENGVVTAVISKQDFYSLQSEQFVKDAFGGSLPAFISAFTSRKELTEKEIFEIKQMIKAFEEK